MGQKDDLPWFSRDFTVYRNLLAAVLILFILYGLIKWLGILDVNVDTASGGLLVALIVGLVAGVSTLHGSGGRTSFGLVGSARGTPSGSHGQRKISSASIL